MDPSKPAKAGEPAALQRRFWNRWNARTRERAVESIAREQRDVVVEKLEELNRTDLDLIDVGCGAGWLCPSLEPFGHVTATDLSDEVLERASERHPEVAFIAGDFMKLDLEPESFDAAVSLEVLAHVPDQPGFIAKLAKLLRPGGVLTLTTQNRPIVETCDWVEPRQPGQLRSWVDKRELHALLEPHFEIDDLYSISPVGRRGVQRILNSAKLNKAIELFFGRAFERLKGRMGLGWTLVAHARKPEDGSITAGAPR